MPSNLSPRIKAIQKSIGIPETGDFDMATCVELERRGNVTVSSTNLITHIKAVQRIVNTGDDGIVGPQTLTKIEGFINPSLPKIPTGGSLVVSSKSMEILIAFEVSSKEAYEKKYQRPIWPGGASGVTIGIGYDCAFCSAAEFTAAWGPFISQGDIDLLLTVRGKSGDKAKALVASVNAVKIPYAVAAKVFYQTTLPSYAKKVRRIYPGVEKLPPDAQGGLLSLVYNRGEDIDPNKSRRKEMFNIVGKVATGDQQGIANEIRGMKRLWPDVKGLRDRRDKEADLVANASFNILPEELIVV